MPRKRRKSSFQNKPSLVFTESPVNIVKNVPSPVMCARYPPTATSVPIDELDELAWVSPQFVRVPSTGGNFGRRRPTKRRYSTSVINKENTTHHAGHNGVGNKGNKFKSLKFVGEKTVEESTAEDVNISYESTSNSDVDSGNDQRISEHDSPAPLTDQQNNRTSKRNQRRFSERLANINFSNDINHSTPRTRNGNTNHDINSSLNDSSDLDLTKIKPKPIMKSPVKCLFASQVPSCDSDKGLIFSDDNDILPTIPMATDTDNKEMDNIKESEISSSSLPDIEIVPNSDSDLETLMTLTSKGGVRRSLRIQMLRKMLGQGVSPDKERVVSKVIVPDTPEDKYGWPLKKYQMFKE